MAAPLLCLLAEGARAVIAAGLFTLSWQHSIEKTEWRETWAVTPHGLWVLEARVKGTGAGMDLPPDATLGAGGWWVYRPALPAQARLRFPDSDHAAPLRLCLDEQPCRPLRAWLPAGVPASAPLTLEACAPE